ncbi:MAG TPA: ABC transporter ATP-binding protein [Geobacteraceae bacterium]
MSGQIDTCQPFLRVEDLVVEFPVSRGRRVHAVSRVSFYIGRGEIFGLAGESGCGKSSLARAIMHLPRPTSGKVVLDGEDLTALDRHSLRLLRNRFQMIFQDPVASLNPFRRVGKSIEAPLRGKDRIDRTARMLRARDMLTAVGLDPEIYYHRRPFQLSGGQCQRVSIARALMPEPQLLICDEPVSALDVSIQAQIINLLREVKQRYGLSVLFISHDLAVVKNICDRVAVMYLGRLCEVASTVDLYSVPAHPYTRALLDAVPWPDPQRPLAKICLKPGEAPSPVDPPSGCRFRTRCPRAQEKCAIAQPELQEIAPGHSVACHYSLWA